MRRALVEIWVSLFVSMPCTYFIDTRRKKETDNDDLFHCALCSLIAMLLRRLSSDDDRDTVVQRIIEFLNRMLTVRLCLCHYRNHQWFCYEKTREENLLAVESSSRRFRFGKSSHAPSTKSSDWKALSFWISTKAPSIIQQEKLQWSFFRTASPAELVRFLEQSLVSLENKLNGARSRCYRVA